MVDQKLTSAPITQETRNALRKLAAHHEKPIYVLLGELVMKERDRQKAETPIENM